MTWTTSRRPAGRWPSLGGDHRKVVQAGQWDRAVQGYLASIAFADAEIGRLLDALDASPHGKNTIIVFWGDHGWHLGQKEHWRKFALGSDFLGSIDFPRPRYGSPGRCATGLPVVEGAPVVKGPPVAVRGPSRRRRSAHLSTEPDPGASLRPTRPEPPTDAGGPTG